MRECYCTLTLLSILSPATIAPAIVISSLGGLVYGKDILTPKDAYRARMLRKALKAPLGHPRYMVARARVICNTRFFQHVKLAHRIVP